MIKLINNRRGKKMIYIAIIIGCILGALIGINAPIISYTYSSYLAIAIIAALDSVFGGIASVINKKFDKDFLNSYIPCNESDFCYIFNVYIFRSSAKEMYL